MGAFENVLPIRTYIPEKTTFGDLLAALRRTLNFASAHDTYPFELLRAEVLPHLADDAQVCQALFSFNEDRVGLGALEATSVLGPSNLFGIGLAGMRLVGGERSEFDLSLRLGHGADGGLCGSLVYRTDVLAGASATRLAAHMQALLLSLVNAGADRPLFDYPILRPSEQDELVSAWATPASTNLAATADLVPAYRMFEATAQRVPDALAVSFPSAGVDLTYAQLEARSAELAAYLSDRHGVGRDVLVCVCVPRSPLMVVCVVAVLRAGGCYVPLDPGYPVARLRYMISNSAAAITLVAREVAHLFEGDGHESSGGDNDANGAVAVVVVDELDTSTYAGAAHPNPAAPPGSDEAASELASLCYTIYTSGSTGQPKGVTMPHNVLANLTAWQHDHFRCRPDGARTLQFATLSFDVHFQEFWSALSTGGSLHLLTEDTHRDMMALLTYICDQAIERLFVPFVALQALAETAGEYGNFPPRLTEVITAGEQLICTPEVVSFFGAIPDSLLYNHYGPSETHVITALVLDGDPSAWPALPSIGRPIDNAFCYIVDRSDGLAPLGVAGELLCGGPVLARGYRGRPDLTEAVFVPNPWWDASKAGTGGATRMYRTGDLCRYALDGTGNIEYISRISSMIKVGVLWCYFVLVLVFGFGFFFSIVSWFCFFETGWRIGKPKKGSKKEGEGGWVDQGNPPPLPRMKPRLVTTLCVGTVVCRDFCPTQRIPHPPPASHVDRSAATEWNWRK